MNDDAQALERVLTTLHDGWQAQVGELLSKLESDRGQKRQAGIFIAVSKLIPAMDMDVPVGLNRGAWHDAWHDPGLARRATFLLNERALTHADVTHILTRYIRPIFQHGHANIHAGTGRAQNGTPDAVWHDNAPTWQSGDNVNGHIPLGCENVLAWLITRLGSVDNGRAIWEDVWPQLLPPIMTWFDAPDTQAKLYAVCVTHKLVRHAPLSLLQRTGIDCMLVDALSRTLTFMTDARLGPVILSATIEARLALISRLPMDRQFDAQAKLVSESVLTALSYCAPASASAHALLPADATRMATLSSPRLQQALAYVACIWAQMLVRRIGEASLRFWNAWMEWASAWLDHAFDACHTPFPEKKQVQPLSDVVNAIVEQGEATFSKVALQSEWVDAAIVLLSCVRACTEATYVFVDMATDAQVKDTPLPVRPPGISAWSVQLLIAACKCVIRLSELESNALEHVKPALLALQSSLHALCHAVIRADPSLQASLPKFISLAPTRLDWLTENF